MAAIERLCVYCGSSAGLDPRYGEGARALGSLLAASGIELVYGGGRIGLMGLMADAVLAGGGRVTGIIPGHLQEREVGHCGLTDLVVVASMHDRKRRMFEMADAIAVLPGGLGTLDETFEIITWRQLGLHDKPILLLDLAGYWKPLLGLIDHVIAGGFARPAARGLFQVIDGVDDLLPALSRLPEERLPTRSGLV